MQKVSFPKKAVVLAAGFGSRLAPLTQWIPKPLLPVKGEAMLGRCLRQLQTWGVEEVALNLHHGAGQIFAAAPSLCPAGLKLTFSFEPRILGTGGALRRLAWFFDDAPFWLLNADVWMALEPEPLQEAFAAQAALAALWMVPDAGPKTVQVQDGRVVDFRGGGQTFSGLHLLHPRLLQWIPEEEGFSSVISAYEAAMRAGETVLGVTVPGSQWADIGTPSQWLAAEGRGICLPGGVVEAGAAAATAIVAPGARVRAGRRVSGMVLPPEWGLDAEARNWFPDAEAVEFLAARGSDRRFRRVLRPQGTVLLMDWGGQRPENDRFVSHTRRLAARGIRVPEILAERKDGRGIAVEDLGGVHLLDEPGEASTREALALAARLHQVRDWQTFDLEPAFDAELVRWEHALFFREFLARHDPEMPPETLQPDLTAAGERLLKQPQVLMHRDLQSTNFLRTPGGMALIDYQGMRAGPAAYDVASLLADPYVDRAAEVQLRLLTAYSEAGGEPIAESVYRAAAVQRLIQALGAYGRLGAQPGTRRFLQYILPALRQLQHWAPSGPLQNWAIGFYERQMVKNTLGPAA